MTSNQNKRARLRHRALSRRLSGVLARPRGADADRRYTSWPARPAVPPAGVRTLQRGPVHFHQRRTAEAACGCRRELGCHRVSRATARYPYSPRGGHYLAFLGRISPEKRVDLAIAVARRAGLPLRIAAKVDPADREYFDRHIRPLLDDPLVEYIGEIGDRDKPAFLGGAMALMFPIDWPEPFGLVMLEAMACGTPVIARPYGSVPEVIRPGVTGFVADTVDEMVDAVKRLDVIDRGDCRRWVEERFSVERMAVDYERVYFGLARRTRSERNG